jgi:hypothetical protein
MKLTIKLLFGAITLMAANSFAYQLSDINGNWYSERFGVSMTMSGLPKGKVKLNETYIASYRAHVNGISVVGYCEVAQVKANFFESRCHTAANGNSISDHTYMRFIDKNTMEEDDLMYGFGKVVSTRVR